MTVSCVVPQGCNDAAELGHSCDVSADSALRRRAESVCHRLLENPFTHCHGRVRQSWDAAHFEISAPHFTTLLAFLKIFF